MLPPQSIPSMPISSPISAAIRCSLRSSSRLVRQDARACGRDAAGRLSAAHAARHGAKSSMIARASQAPRGAGLSFDAAALPAPLPLRRRPGVWRCLLIFGLVTIQWLGLFLAYDPLIGRRRWPACRSSILLWLYVAAEPRHEGDHHRAEVARSSGARSPACIRCGASITSGSGSFRVCCRSRRTSSCNARPLCAGYMRPWAPRSASDAMIGEFECGAIDLISIGDRASLGLQEQVRQR